MDDILFRIVFRGFYIIKKVNKRMEQKITKISKLKGKEFGCYIEKE
jgi:hypothetical protein